MGDPAGRQRGLCRQHGRRAGGLSEAARSAASARVPRRNLKAADHRDARTDPREAGTQGASRLRIRTQWRRQSVHGVRAAGRVEACESDRPPHRHLMLRDLSDVHFPDAAKIVLVQDNLNTHKPASLYEAFPAAEARRLVERFEWHYTPKHGSWLDMAESELGVLASQCLDRRIADKQTLVQEIAAWERDRNANHTKANWQFSTPNARIKLKHLYPSI